MCNEANTFENHDFFVKSLFWKKVSAPIFRPKPSFSNGLIFFSEGVRPSGFFYREIESGKYMGKLTELKNIASASRNLKTKIFPLDFCGYPVRTFLNREISQFKDHSEGSKTTRVI